MSTIADPNARLMKILQATPEQSAAIDRILAGETSPAPQAPSGPLLMNMSQAAKFLGVSRGTLWRITTAGRLRRIEVLAGSYRIARADAEAFALQGARP